MFLLWLLALGLPTVLQLNGSPHFSSTNTVFASSHALMNRQPVVRYHSNPSQDLGTCRF